METNDIESAISKVNLNSQLIVEANMGDKLLQRLEAEKVRIYTFAIPIVIKKEDEEEVVWLDETNNPRLLVINEAIERRTQEIKEWFKT